ncbi:MAG: ion transporter [Planctomycetes bacterium]|nr:ion transporter [Planctomycetota bacterium]
MQERIDRFLHDPLVEIGLILLILLSVTLLVAEVRVDRTAEHYSAIHFAGNLINGLFILELAARYRIAQSKRRFFRQYWLDILSVIPALPGFRILRVLRMLRLLRAGVLINRRLASVSSLLSMGFGAQIGLFLLLGVVILAGALAIHLLEGGENAAFQRLPDAVWWSLFTVLAGEPVGGEAKSTAGRFVTLVVAAGGLTMFAVFTGVVSAIMVQRLKVGMDMKDLDLDELREHIIICGWNRSAHILLAELQSDASVKARGIVIVAEFEQTPEEDLKRVDRSRIYFYSGDYTNIEVLEEVGMRHASQAILLADKTLPRSDQDRDARTVLAALTIEKLNPRILTCAQLLDRKNNVQLQVAGVEDVVIADEVSGHLIATWSRHSALTRVFMELLSAETGNNLYKVILPRAWSGISFQEAARRSKEEHDALLVAVEREDKGGRETVVNPPASATLSEGDWLILIARDEPRAAG